MKSAILFLCFSGLVMGYDETCKAKGESCVAPEDELQLMQVRTQVHKHKHSRMTNTEMHEVLASFEEEKGPVALQELLQVLMVLPVLKSDEAMLAAVHAQPQLQHLAKRYPNFLHTLGIFEDPKAIQQIKAAVFEALRSPMKMQGRQPSVAAPARGRPGNTKLLALSEDPSSILAWVENWGCTAKVGFTDFPKASWGMESVPIFGPDCQGYPWISELVVKPDDEGAIFVYGNYSMETYETTYSVAFVGEHGYKELGALGASVHSFAFGSDALYYIAQAGDWPDYTYQLMSATPEAVTELTNITNCLYPWGVEAVPGSTMVIWQCSKDWANVNDTYKIMKYSSKAGTPEILTESTEYFGHMTITGSQLYYSQYNSTTWDQEVYTCPIASCDPVKVGVLPEGAWHFIITESGELLTTRWVSWKMSSSSGSEYWYTNNVTVSPLDDLGATHTLFPIPGTNQLQLVQSHPDKSDSSSHSSNNSSKLPPAGATPASSNSSNNSSKQNGRR